MSTSNCYEIVDYEINLINLLTNKHITYFQPEDWMEELQNSAEHK